MRCTDKRYTPDQKRHLGSKETKEIYQLTEILGTVLVIIKLTKNAVPLRFRCGSCKLKLCRYFIMF